MEINNFTLIILILLLILISKIFSFKTCNCKRKKITQSQLPVTYEKNVNQAKELASGKINELSNLESTEIVQGADQGLGSSKTQELQAIIIININF